MNRTLFVLIIALVVSYFLCNTEGTNDKGSSEGNVVQEVSSETLELAPKASIDFSCMGAKYNFTEELLDLIQEMEAMDLPYTAHSGKGEDLLLDCSGIFTRVINSLHQKLAACNNLIFPSKKTGQRSSRSYAVWYADHDNAILIQGDPQHYGKHIHPGAVLFYGTQNRTYKKVNRGTLASEVEHVGIVTDVTKNEEGEVINYGLFHGHGKTGTQADITRWHKWKEGREAFSNGNQQLIAIAPMITTKR